MMKVAIGILAILMFSILAFGQATAGFMDMGGYFCYDTTTLQFTSWVPYPYNDNAADAQQWCVDTDGGRQ